MAIGAKAGLILVVDDYEEVRELTAEVLVGAGYAVVAVADANQALEEARRSAKDLRLVVTDLNMPGMLGSELASAIRAFCPGVRVLYISGDLSVPDIAAGELLLKPFTASELLSQVDSAMTAAED